ncbi:cell envelope protein SmpA [Pseudomonas sp. MYb118]|uniref:cell envelope protein SmpA n=1 Tax=Pseudomonas sp. MYb118 TaxID=1848720 RepID=UPI0034CD74BC
MPSNAHSFLMIALLCPPLAATATTVHRCEAANGRVTFTTLGCASGDNPSLQEVRTYKPGSTVALMPAADARKTSTTAREPTVVGLAQDSCGNLITARERRDAILHKRIVAGMSQQDVESALGKPDKVSVRNSAMSYRYDTRRGRSAHIEFDEKGCTKGKAKSRTAKSPR